MSFQTPQAHYVLRVQGNETPKTDYDRRRYREMLLKSSSTRAILEERIDRERFQLFSGPLRRIGLISAPDKRGVTMRRYFLVPFLMATLMAGSQATGSSAKANIQVIPISRVVRIPLIALNDGITANLATDFSGLAVSRGGEDETPEGPDGFDVNDNGSFLVTNPLLGRLSQFSSEGTFQRSWLLGFAADSVHILPDKTVEVEEARTSTLYVLDQKGELHPSTPHNSNAPARITSPSTGVIACGASNSGSCSQINVQIDRPGFTLLSLQLLAMGEDGSVYVALESTPGAKGEEGINVNKSVRRYSPDGKLLSQTDDIPLDYYVIPVDELRVRKGFVYQMLTTPSEVQLNIWNMN